MIILVIISFLIDLISKIIVSKILSINEVIVVIKDFFNITYVRNTGAAWSIFAGETLGLIIISLIIIALICYYISKNKIKSKLELVGYSLILGGAIGNLYDRIVYGYVIDFLDFYIFGYDYPIFNLADSFIFIGVMLIVVYTWRYENGNESNR